MKNYAVLIENIVGEVWLHCGEMMDKRDAEDSAEAAKKFYAERQIPVTVYVSKIKEV